MEGQLLGRVTWFNEAKGYGEILSENNQAFFFTYKELRFGRGSHKTITRNTVVSFAPQPRRVFGMRVASEVKAAKAQLEFTLDSNRDLTTGL